MNYFMREVSRAIGKVAGRINHIFGGRYKSSIIYDPVHFAHVYKYIYRNPVEAGLAKKVEEYPYSSIPILFGTQPVVFPVWDLNCHLASWVPESWDRRLSWLNLPYTQEQSTVISNALRRVEFSFSKQRNVRHTVSGLMELPAAI